MILVVPRIELDLANLDWLSLSRWGRFAWYEISRAILDANPENINYV